MNAVLQTTYNLLEIAVAFAAIVFFGYSFLCMWYFLTTEPDEARGYKKKSLTRFNFHMGRAFLIFYCVLGTLGLIRAVVVDVGLSFFGVAVLVTIAALVAYVLKKFRG